MKILPFSFSYVKFLPLMTGHFFMKFIIPLRIGIQTFLANLIPRLEKIFSLQERNLLSKLLFSQRAYQKERKLK